MNQVPVDKLMAIFVVFAEDGEQDVWGTQITAQVVKDYIAAGKLESRPYQTALTDDTYDHAARIAYLCVNRDKTPIEIDVGAPCLRYFERTLSDGYHRFAASIVMGDSHIPASVAGESNYMKHLFVKPRPEYADI